jgi:hypothetical protein
VFDFLAIFLFFFGIGAILGIVYGLIRGLPPIIGIIVREFKLFIKDIKAIAKPGPEGVEAARKILNRDRQ